MKSSLKKIIILFDGNFYNNVVTLTKSFSLGLCLAENSVIFDEITSLSRTKRQR